MLCREPADEGIETGLVQVEVLKRGNGREKRRPGSWGRREEKWEAEVDQGPPSCASQPISHATLKNGRSTMCPEPWSVNHA